MKVQVEGKEMEVTFLQGELRIDGKSYSFAYDDENVLWNGKSHHIELLAHHVIIDSRPYALKNISEQSVQQGAVTSPITGIVAKVSAKVGDNVKKGDTLMIIEAMKMENHISAPKDGKVKLLLVKTGDLVKEEQTLIEIQ